MATNVGSQSAKAIIQQSLDQWGLGTLGGWVWRQFLRSGASDPAEALLLIMPDLRNRPEYKARFPAMEALAARGQAISEQEYVQYERTVAQVMRAAGMPAGFYDSPNDYAELLKANVSPAEVQDRIMDGYARVSGAAIEVREAFAEFFGAAGDNALAAYFIDPLRAQPLLERQMMAATVGGIGRRYGVGTGREQALRLAEIGVTDQQAEQGFAQLRQAEGLFRENVGERDALEIEEEGVGAVFGLSAEDQRALEERAQTRQAAFAGSGGAAVEQRGVTGLGTAGRG